MLNLYVALLTAMRKQPHILGAYSAGTLALLLLGRPVLRNSGLLSLCRLYLIVMSLAVIYCAAVCILTIRKSAESYQSDSSAESDQSD